MFRGLQIDGDNLIFAGVGLKEIDIIPLRDIFFRDSAIALPFFGSHTTFHLSPQAIIPLRTLFELAATASRTSLVSEA